MQEWNWPPGCEDQGVDKQHEDEDDPLPPVQRRQLAWVIMKFPAVFIDHAGTKSSPPQMWWSELPYVPSHNH